MRERTLVFVKPHCFNDENNLADEILGKLELLAGIPKCGILVKLPVFGVPEDILRRHYQEHEGKDYYERLIRQISGKNIYLAIYAGEDVVKRVRDVIGATNPAKATVGTIRRHFSNDSIDVAASENRAVNNVVHASSDPKAAQEEMNIWLHYILRLDSN